MAASSGTAVLADRKTWSFEHLCMTTWDSRRLGHWLNAVADGPVQPSPFGTGQDEQLLLFAEPNVAFSLQECIAGQVRVRGEALDAHRAAPLQQYLQGPG